MSEDNDGVLHRSDHPADDNRRPEQAARRNRSASHDDEVGYRRPPKATRFKKGQSGNPRGRPKKTARNDEADARQMIRDVIFTPVTLSINGKSVRMPAFKATLVGLQSKALKLDMPAIRELVRIIERSSAWSEKSPNPDQESGVLLVRAPIMDPAEWERCYGRNLAEYQERVRKEWEDKHGPVSSKGTSRNG